MFQPSVGRSLFMQKFAHVVTAVALFASVGLPAIACEEEAKNKTSVQPEQKTTTTAETPATAETTKVAEGTTKTEAKAKEGCDPNQCPYTSKNKEAQTEPATKTAEAPAPETTPGTEATETPATAAAPKETKPTPDPEEATEKPKEEAAKPAPATN
jgi:cytoskeletal protein RodZ